MEEGCGKLCDSVATGRGLEWPQQVIPYKTGNKTGGLELHERKEIPSIFRSGLECEIASKSSIMESKLPGAKYFLFHNIRNAMQKKMGVSIYPTQAFIEKDDIQRGLKMLKKIWHLGRVSFWEINMPCCQAVVIYNKHRHCLLNLHTSSRFNKPILFL